MRATVCVAAGLLATLLSLAPSQAQVLPFRVYTQRDGLGSDATNILMEDSQGYLWVGTNEGISVFDGKLFENFTAASGLGEGFPSIILESRIDRGTVYAGMLVGGITAFHGRSTAGVPIDTSTASRVVIGLAESPKGDLWCVTKGGVYRITKSGAKRTGVAERLGTTDLTISPAPSGRFWIIADTLIYTLDPDDASTSLADFHLPRGHHPHTVIRSRDSSSWIGTVGGDVYRLDRDGLTFVYNMGSPVNALAFDHDGTLWAGTYDGLFHITLTPGAQTVSRYTTANGLPEKSIHDLCVDREGDLWVATEGSGLALLPRIRQVRFPLTQGPAGNMYFSSAVQDDGGHLWALSGDTLNEFWRAKGWKWEVRRHLPPVGGPAGGLHALRAGEGYRLWLSYIAGGLKMVGISRAPGGGSTLSAGTMLRPGRGLPPGAHDYFIPIGGDSVFYESIDLSSQRRRVYHAIIDRRTGRGELLPETLGLVNPFVVDAWGNLFSAGNNLRVVNLHDRRILRIYDRADGLTDPNGIRALFRDREGRIWIGMRRGGAAVLDGDTIRSISVREGLISVSVWGFTEDDSGRIWAATGNGMQAIVKRTLQPVPPRRELTGFWAIACGYLGQGTIWWYESVPGHPSLVVSDLETDPPLPPPPMYIAGMRVNGRAVPMGEENVFAFDENNCRVDFLGISLGWGDRILYRHKLEGADREWSPPGYERSISYSSLSPGGYTFVVQAITPDGVGSEPARISFEILAPLWQRWWFIAFSVGAALVLLYMLYRYRLAKILELESVRISIATDLHDEIGTGLTRIALFSDTGRRDLRRLAAGEGETASAEERLELLLKDIGASSRELVDAMSDIVWAVDPKNDSFEAVLLRLKILMTKLLEAKGVDVEIDIPASVGSLHVPVPHRKHIFLIFKEALTNVVKHSAARRVKFFVRRRGNALEMHLIDDGSGMSPGKTNEGYGLRNMQRRAKEIGADVTLRSAPGEGTSISLTLKIP